MNADQLETILNKQRDYLVDVLGTNRQWMQEQLAKQVEEYGKLQLSRATQSPANSDLTSQNRHVPAFTPFSKEKNNWDLYTAQMQQHFEAYKVDIVLIAKSYETTQALKKKRSSAYCKQTSNNKASSNNNNKF